MIEKDISKRKTNKINSISKTNNKNEEKKVLDLSGVYPPIPTTFDQDGHINETAIKQNFKFWKNYDLKGYVIMGSNGEYVLLDTREKIELMEIARTNIPQNRLMIAGTGCQSTKKTITLTKEAHRIGADAALILTPYYYKSLMTPQVMIKHYHTIADASEIPIIIYNMPACSGIDLTAETIAELSKHSNIIGIKDSSGNIVKIGDIVRLTDPQFQVLAGSASFLYSALLVGAVGGIMAMANIAPGKCIQLYNYTMQNKLKEAKELQLQLIPVNTAITRQWGVPALKAAMDYLGLQGGPTRPPLQPLTTDIKEKLYQILKQGNLNPI
jgi:4-hydroxy-2-oxoglutarate aldolase